MKCVVDVECVAIEPSDERRKLKFLVFLRQARHEPREKYDWNFCFHLRQSFFWSTLLLEGISGGGGGGGGEYS